MKFRERLEHAAVAAGLAVEVPDSTIPATGEAVQTVAHREQPDIPTSSSSSDSIARAVSSGSADSSEVDERFATDFQAILQGMPTDFQTFLTQEAELKETLRGTVPDGDLSATATKAAAKVSHLTPKGVNDGIRVATESLKGLRADFDRTLAQMRKERVDDPKSSIETTRAKIQEAQGKIEELQRQKAVLEASIEPTQRSITEAEEGLNHGVAVFTASCAKIEEKLSAMSQELLVLTASKSQGRKK